MAMIPVAAAASLVLGSGVTWKLARTLDRVKEKEDREKLAAAFASDTGPVTAVTEIHVAPEHAIEWLRAAREHVARTKSLDSNCLGFDIVRPRDATPADPVFVWMKTFVSHESHSRYLEAPYVIEFLAATKAWVIEAKTVISDIVTPSLPMTRAVFSDSQRVRLCIFQVNLLKLDTFVSQLKSIQFVAKTVAEPLCLAYYWVQDTANPNVFAALQAFAPGGLEAHNASAHTSQLSPVWQECVEAVEVTEGFALGNLGSGIGVPKLDSGSHAAARRSSIHQMPDLSPPPLSLSPHDCAGARVRCARFQTNAKLAESLETKLSTARYLHLANEEALCFVMLRTAPNPPADSDAPPPTAAALPSPEAPPAGTAPPPPPSPAAPAAVSFACFEVWPSGVTRNGEADAEELANEERERCDAVAQLDRCIRQAHEKAGAPGATVISGTVYGLEA